VTTTGFSSTRRCASRSQVSRYSRSAARRPLSEPNTSQRTAMLILRGCLGRALQKVLGMPPCRRTPSSTPPAFQLPKVVVSRRGWVVGITPGDVAGIGRRRRSRFTRRDARSGFSKGSRSHRRIPRATNHRHRAINVVQSRRACRPRLEAEESSPPGLEIGAVLLRVDPGYWYIQNCMPSSRPAGQCHCGRRA